MWKRYSQVELYDVRETLLLANMSESDLIASRHRFVIAMNRVCRIVEMALDLCSNFTPLVGTGQDHAPRITKIMSDRVDT